MVCALLLNHKEIVLNFITNTRWNFFNLWVNKRSKDLFINPVGEKLNKTPRAHPSTYSLQKKTPMSDIAERVLSNPQTCKKPAPAACAASRAARDAKTAEEASVYHWTEFDIIVVDFPHKGEIQEFRQRCRQSRKTAELVRQRDNLLSRFTLPSSPTN